MLGIAERGYSYEQEMAFFPGLPLIIGLIGGWQGNEKIYMFLGTMISCISSILATHVLYTLTLSLTSSKSWASKSASKLGYFSPASFIRDSPSRDIPFSAIYRIYLCTFHIPWLDISVLSSLLVCSRWFNTRERTVARWIPAL
jgi:hypothetical protein